MERLTVVLLGLSLLGYYPSLCAETNGLECRAQIFPDHENCQKYYICDSGKELHLTCPAEELFDFSMSKCLDSKKATCFTLVKLSAFRSVSSLQKRILSDSDWPTPEGPNLPTPPGPPITDDIDVEETPDSSEIIPDDGSPPATITTTAEPDNTDSTVPTAPGPIPTAPGPIPTAPGPLPTATTEFIPTAPGPIPTAPGPVPTAPGPIPTTPHPESSTPVETEHTTPETTTSYEPELTTLPELTTFPELTTLPDLTTLPQITTLPPLFGPCSSPGQYVPHPTDCNRYFQCFNGGYWERYCGVGLHFNPSFSICDFPETAGCVIN